jgi:hypothetical protein
MPEGLLPQLADIPSLLERGEGQTVEFKLEEMRPNDLAETMCAFANRNDGIILIGVDDSGRVVGVADPKEVEEFVVNVSRHNCDRPIFPRIESVRIDTVQIVVVSVSMDGKAHAVGGRFYVRVGSTDQPANVEEVETLIESMKPAISERESLEGRSGSALIAYFATIIGGGLFLFLMIWTSSPVSAFVPAIFGTALVGAVIFYLKELTHLTNIDMAALMRRRQPLVLFAFILFTMGTITLDLSLMLYPLYSKVIFSTQLSALSVFSPMIASLVALAEGAIGVPGMQHFDSVHIRQGTRGYVRRFKSYGKTGVAVGLVVLAVGGLVVPADIALVLWTPKVGLVEYRYVTGDTIYIVPLGHPRFEAYTINEELVHVLWPAYPLVTSFTYLLVNNSTRESTILKQAGASCQLVTASGLLTGLGISFAEPPSSDPVCYVRYYNGLDVSSIMSFEESTPDLPIRAFENGTAQWQHTIVIKNLSQQYSLQFMPPEPLLHVRGWYNVTIVNNDADVGVSPSPAELGVYLYLAPSSLKPNGFAKIVIVYNGP